jgi:hypothetical protein
MLYSFYFKSENQITGVGKTWNVTTDENYCWRWPRGTPLTSKILLA